MGKFRKPVQIVILLAVLVIGGYAIGSTLWGGDNQGPLKRGEQPPGFTLADLAGEAVSLSDFEGRPVIINFWGTFCEPCVREMPEFQRQYDEWKDAGLVILAVNLSEDTLTVNNFVKRLNLTYPILRDKGRKTERSYFVRSYPTTFFIAPNGELMDVVAQELTREQLEERIERLLEL